MTTAHDSTDDATSDALELDYFRRLYAREEDPWGFDRRWYEQRKYALTCAALPEPRFSRGLEAGCSNGALTARLAARCDELIAFDALPDVAERARGRVADHPGVSVLQARYPAFWPDGDGDLVVWSEIAYYLTESGRERALEGLQRWLRPGGVLVAVHYIGVTDYPQTGASVGAWLDDVGFLHRETRLEDPHFHLGVWRRTT